MKQIVAIFIKDARRLWPELLVSLALLAALVAIYPGTWRTMSHSDAVSFSRFPGLAMAGVDGSEGFLAGCIVVLIPIGWWVLITHLVHIERLVGSTQFWLTRPYAWPVLLVAKLLFLGAFLYLPLLVAQCLLLSAAGFAPLSHLGGLLFGLLLVTMILVLPILALSTLTSGFARMTLAMLGVLVYIAAVAVLNASLPTMGSTPDILAGDIAGFLFVAGCASVVLQQYAGRRTRTAWITFCGIVLLLTTVAFVSPDQALMQGHYPVSSGAAAPAEFEFAPTAMVQPMAHGTDKSSNILEIMLPLKISGVADGTAVLPVAVQAGIDSGEGSWQSPWQTMYNERYLPGVTDATIHFRIRRDVFERFKSTPVKLRLAIAIERVRAVSTQRISLPATEFRVNGIGICTPGTRWWLKPKEITAIDCRWAMRQPPLTYVTVQWTEGECASPQPGASSPRPGAGWTGSLSTDPAEFGITSVWSYSLNLSNAWPDYHQGESPIPRQLCPGSPVIFTTYGDIRRSQVGLEIPNFRLPELSTGAMIIERAR